MVEKKRRAANILTIRNFCLFFLLLIYYSLIIFTTEFESKFWVIVVGIICIVFWLNHCLAIGFITRRYGMCENKAYKAGGITTAFFEIALSHYLYYSKIGVLILSIAINVLVFTSLLISIRTSNTRINLLVQCIVNSGSVFLIIMKYLIQKYYLVNFAIRDKKMIFVLCFFGILALISGICIYLCIKFDKIENYFLGTVICLGAFYLTILPPMSAPDEECHFAMAYSYSNVLLGGERYLGEAGTRENGNGCMFYYIPARQADAECISNTFDFEYVWQYPGFEIYDKCIQQYVQRGTIKQFESSFVGRFTNGSFIVYIPAIVGVTFARILGASGMQLIFAGRVFNFAFFCIMGYWSIRILPVGKKIFWVISMLPMTMQLAASYSYDSVLIAGAFFMSAYCLSLIINERSITNSDVAYLCIGMLICSSAKVFYACIGTLILCIPHRKFGSMQKKIMKCALVFAVAVIGIIYSSSGGIAGYVESASDTEYITISYAIRNAEKILYLMVNSVVSNSEYYWGTMMGYLLGWLEFRISFLIISLFAILLFCSCIEESGIAALSKKISYLSMCIFCIVTGCILFTTVLWTRTDRDIVEGFQGRYLLEVLPLLMLGVSGILRMKGIGKRDVQRIAIAGYCANVLCLLTVFNQIMTR